MAIGKVARDGQTLEEWHEEVSQIAKRAFAKAQEESRQLGVPNVYCIDGQIMYELPDGSLSPEDPWPAMQAEKAAREQMG